MVLNESIVEFLELGQLLRMGQNVLNQNEAGLLGDSVETLALRFNGAV